MASLASRKRISLPCCPRMALLYSQLSEVGAEERTEKGRCSGTERPEGGTKRVCLCTRRGSVGLQLPQAEPKAK